VTRAKDEQLMERVLFFVCAERRGATCQHDFFYLRLLSAAFIGVASGFELSSRMQVANSIGAEHRFPSFEVSVVDIPHVYHSCTLAGQWTPIW